MQIKADSVDEYIQLVPDNQREAIIKLRKIISNNIPKGFEECINYNMIGYVVPHSLFPAGYHCDPKLPLPFGNIAAQKNFIGVYHMGMYANPDILNWFQTEFPKHSKAKLDMGKSCIRLKKYDDIPYELIGELFKKMTVKDWVNLYKNNLDNRK